MIKNICHILILGIFNYIALNFIIDNINNNINQVVYIYAIGILFGLLSIFSYFILNKAFK